MILLLSCLLIYMFASKVAIFIAIESITTLVVTINSNKIKSWSLYKISLHNKNKKKEFTTLSNKRRDRLSVFCLRGIFACAGVYPWTALDLDPVDGKFGRASPSSRKYLIWSAEIDQAKSGLFSRLRPSLISRDGRERASDLSNSPSLCRRTRQDLSTLAEIRAPLTPQSGSTSSSW